MTSTRLRGVNRVRAKGPFYYYHRTSGKRIRANPTDEVAFAAEVAALDAITAVTPTRKLPATLGGVLSAYKASSAYMELSPDTQKGYRRAFDKFKPIDAMPVSEIDAPFVLEFRERIYQKHGRWLANMIVSVLSLMFNWAIPRGLATHNVTVGIRKIRPSKQRSVANRAWTTKEVAAALDAATGRLRKAIALAYYAGLRKKDVVELRRSSRTAGTIVTIQSKTGHELSLLEAKALTVILDEPDKKPGEHVVVNRSGHGYTRDGLDSVFEKLKRDLLVGEQIGPGLTFHGLRKSLAKRAADAGFSELDIAAALGHANPATSRPYTIEAARKRGARRVIQGLDKRRTGTKRELQNSVQNSAKLVREHAIYVALST